MLFNNTSGDRSLDLPSWVPDWETQHQSDLGGLSSDIRLRRNQEGMFAASGDSPWSAVRRTEKVIRIRGFRVDTIVDIQVLENDSTDTYRMYEDLDNFIVDIYDTYGCPRSLRSERLKAQKWILDSTYPSGITVRDALARTICNDCVPHGKGLLRKPNFKDELKLAAWLKGVSTPYGTTLVKKISQGIHFDSGIKESVGSFVRDILRGRVFLSTQLGYFGLTAGEDTCQNGDEIWVISGASFPVVLRRARKDGGSSTARSEYLVRSEAYVHGLMHGEAVSGKSPVLPKSDAVPGSCASKIREELTNGKRTWPTPEWSEILLV